MQRPAYKVRFLLHKLEKEMDLTKLLSLERVLLDVMNNIVEKNK